MAYSSTHINFLFSLAILSAAIALTNIKGDVNENGIWENNNKERNIPNGIQHKKCVSAGGVCKRTGTCTTGNIAKDLCTGSDLVTCCLPPMSADFAGTLVTLALSEHLMYSGLHECNDPNMRRRIAAYWDGIGFELNDCNQNYGWSAAFISYIIRSAGPPDRFRYASAHSAYIDDAFSGREGLYDTVRNARIAKIQPGDIVCAGRAAIRDWTFQDFEHWHIQGGPMFKAITTHCDIVTAVKRSSITVVGGNVGQQIVKKTVTKSSYALLLRV